MFLCEHVEKSEFNRNIMLAHKWYENLYGREIELKFHPFSSCTSTEPTAILSEVNHHISTSQHKQIEITKLKKFKLGAGQNSKSARLASIRR